MVYVQVLATFCTTVNQVEQKVPKLTNLLNPWSPFLGIFRLVTARTFLGFPTDIILSSLLISVPHPSHSELSGKARLPCGVLHMKLITQLSWQFQNYLIFLNPPFAVFWYLLFLIPPQAYSSVFCPSFPGPTPYLEYPLAPLEKPPKGS